MKCSLEKGDFLSVEGGPNGLVLRCQEGTIWLTNGDGRDYLVHRDDCFRLPAGATAVVEALGSAEFVLEMAVRQGAGIRPMLALKACRASS